MPVRPNVDHWTINQIDIQRFGVSLKNVVDHNFLKKRKTFCGVLTQQYQCIVCVCSQKNITIDFRLVWKALKHTTKQTKYFNRACRVVCFKAFQTSLKSIGMLLCKQTQTMHCYCLVSTPQNVFLFFLKMFVQPHFLRRHSDITCQFALS